MIYAVFAPIIFALFIPLLNRVKDKVHIGYFVTLIPLAIFIYFIRFVGKGFAPVRESYKWIPSMDINLNFYLDGLSLLFVLLISGIGTLVVLYSSFYLNKSERLASFYTYLLIFMTAMLGVVLSDNVFVLYSFWELTSISSFLLIGYWHFKERSRYGALKSMLITVFGGLSMLGGLILLTVITKTTSIQGMIEQTDVILASPYLPLILIFILIGAFTKSAQFPFHIWLPDAMEAPTPVSAYLHSATMVKAGIYLVARFLPIFNGYDLFFISVSLIGIITLVWGSYMAVRQTDLKSILAFSTISQLGMIMAMLGFGTQAAIFAAVFHILNHATFKGSLFMIAGVIDLQTGTRDIRKLGGLFTLMPITGTLALFASFSMAGVPLPFLNGFYSKELFFASTRDLTAQSGFAQVLVEVIPYLAVIASIFTFIYSMYLFFDVFMKKDKAKIALSKKYEPSLGMLVSPLILVLAIITIGLVPNLFKNGLLSHAAEGISGQSNYPEITYWHGLSPAFIMSLIVLTVGTIMFLLKKYWDTIYNVFPGKLSFNRVYDWLIKRLDTVSKSVTEFYMNGSLRTYMSLILVTMFVVTFVVIFLTNGFTIDLNDLAEVTVLEITVVAAIMIAAVATLFSNNNVAAILILGIVGYGVAILFVVYRAPDIALTQLVIETVTVALFLLTFYHFPKLRKRTETKSTKAVNILISAGFGLMMTVIGISAVSTNGFDKISEFFIKESLPTGGGHNIVNVILVDMRGVDTLFEITVLGIAIFAIYGMIKFRKDKSTESDKEVK